MKYTLPALTFPSSRWCDPPAHCQELPELHMNWIRQPRILQASDVDIGIVKDQLCLKESRQRVKGGQGRVLDRHHVSKAEAGFGFLHRIWKVHLLPRKRCLRLLLAFLTLNSLEQESIQVAQGHRRTFLKARMELIWISGNNMEQCQGCNACLPALFLSGAACWMGGLRKPEGRRKRL